MIKRYICHDKVKVEVEDVVVIGSIFIMLLIGNHMVVLVACCLYTI